MVRLEGTNLDTVLGLFEAERREWIHGAENTRKLTRMESKRVAQRIADRVAARVPLSPSERRRVEAVVARRFYRGATWDEEVTAESLAHDLSNLGPDTLAALREAVALGFRPIDGEP